MSTAKQRARRRYRRVAVSGSPQWSDRTVIRDALSQVWHPETVLMVGPEEQGAAALCRECWTAWGGRVEVHLGDGSPPGDLCLVFLSGRASGSESGARAATEAGVAVVIYRERGPVEPEPVEPVPALEPVPPGESERSVASVPLTLLERMNRAGIGSERARVHLVAGRVRVDGAVVDDPDMPVQVCSRIVLY